MYEQEKPPTIVELDGSGCIACCRLRLRGLLFLFVV